MRVMVIVKASRESEAGVMPTAQLLTDMGKFNEELVKAGVLLAADGLHATSKGKRVRFSGQQRTVIDGPFAEAREFPSPHAAPWVQETARSLARKGRRQELTETRSPPLDLHAFERQVSGYSNIPGL